MKGNGQTLNDMIDFSAVIVVLHILLSGAFVMASYNSNSFARIARQRRIAGRRASR